MQELNRIKEKITLLRLSRNELQIEEFDVEANVNYCLYFMVNVYKLWYEVKLTDKIKFQEMIFRGSFPVFNRILSEFSM